MLRTSNSSVKSDEQHVLWLQERVDSGEIRTEERKRNFNTADNGARAVSPEVLREHLKMLKRSDAEDISWCYAQWCDGLSRGARSWMFVANSCEVRRRRAASLSKASSRATSVNSMAAKVSENARRDGKVRRMDKQGLRICVPL